MWRERLALQRLTSLTITPSRHPQKSMLKKLLTGMKRIKSNKKVLTYMYYVFVIDFFKFFRFFIWILDSNIDPSKLIEQTIRIHHDGKIGPKDHRLASRGLPSDDKG